MKRFAILCGLLLSLSILLNHSSTQSNAVYKPLPLPQYSEEEWNYFIPIAFSAEYGITELKIHKWADPLRLSVLGRPTPEDREALDRVIRDLNDILPGDPVHILRPGEFANVTLYFIPHDDFLKYNYLDKTILQKNWGLSIVWWNKENILTHCVILISTDKPTAWERAHLIREELTQALGLLNDSWQYPDSIFYQGWTTAQDFSELDRKVIQLLYDERIKPGMTLGEVEKTIKPQRSKT